MSSGQAHWPALRGGLLALGAAVLFGGGTPRVQRAGTSVGPLGTAALLYAGAASDGLLQRQGTGRGARLHGRDLPRLAWMALFGAAVGPTALAWGLQRSLRICPGSGRRSPSQRGTSGLAAASNAAPSCARTDNPP